MNIARLDWAVLIAYLVVITAIGLIAGYRVRKTGDYFLGGRRFGPWLMIGQSFGVGTHAEMPVALAGAVYSLGASGIWFQWKNLFATPFYWIMAPVFRRVRRTTMAEFTADRYGPWMGVIYIFFALCFFIINTGSMLKGAGKVISQATGGTVGVNEVVVLMTVMFILYSFVGGLVAAAWTDLFQGVLIIVLSFMLIPLGWGVVGGLSGMKAALEPFRFSLATPSGIGPWVIAMLTINGLVGIMAQPQMLATVGTGRDERTCRIGMLFGNLVKRVCTVGWALVGLIVAAMIARGTADRSMLGDPENAFGFACRQLLFPGALGLMIASVLAANMSTCSAFLVDSGALFTEGLYRPTLVRDRDDRHYLWVGRTSGFAITDARSDLRRLPGPERALHLPDDRNNGDVHGDRRPGWTGVAPCQSLGRAGQPAQRPRSELLPLRAYRSAARSLGRQRLPGSPDRRHPGARYRQPGDSCRTDSEPRFVLRATRNVERFGGPPGRPATVAPRQLPPPGASRRRARLAGLPEDLWGFGLAWLLVISLVVFTSWWLAVS